MDEIQSSHQTYGRHRIAKALKQRAWGAVDYERHGWRYLTIILELFSPEIIGYPLRTGGVHAGSATTIRHGFLTCPVFFLAGFACCLNNC